MLILFSQQSIKSDNIGKILINIEYVNINIGKILLSKIFFCRNGDKQY